MNICIFEKIKKQTYFGEITYAEMSVHHDARQDQVHDRHED